MEGERGREGGEMEKEMRDCSKSQNRPNLREHCMQLMSEELDRNIPELSWQTSDSITNP